MEAIENEILNLSEIERKQLGEWFGELEEAAWDLEMARDFSADGRGAGLVERVDREIAEGKFLPFDEGMDERQRQSQE